MFMMFICSLQFKLLHGDHSFTTVPKLIDLQDNTSVTSVHQHFKHTTATTQQTGHSFFFVLFFALIFKRFKYALLFY